MKSFAFVLLSVGCLFVAIRAAAIEPKVTELLKDDTESTTSAKDLSTNEDCIQPKETGRCFALFYRFAYDVEKRECVEFIYGGCDGNSNNFETQDECEAKCVKNKQNSSKASAEMEVTTAVPSAAAETTTVTTVDAAS